MSGRSVNLTTLFLGRLRPPKRLTSTLCTYLRQKLTTALLEKAEGETKVCCQTGYRTQDPRLMSQVPYRLRYEVQLVIVLPLFTCYLYCRGRTLTYVGRTGGLTHYISRWQFTLKASNKNCSRRHFNFLLLSFEENKACFFHVNPLPSRGFT